MSRTPAWLLTPAGKIAAGVACACLATAGAYAATRGPDAATPPTGVQAGPLTPTQTLLPNAPWQTTAAPTGTSSGTATTSPTLTPSAAPTHAVTGPVAVPPRTAPPTVKHPTRPPATLVPPSTKTTNPLPPKPSVSLIPYPTTPSASQTSWAPITITASANPTDDPPLASDQPATEAEAYNYQLDLCPAYQLVAVQQLVGRLVQNAPVDAQGECAWAIDTDPSATAGTTPLQIGVLAQPSDSPVMIAKTENRQPTPVGWATGSAWVEPFSESMTYVYAIDGSYAVKVSMTSGDTTEVTRVAVPLARQALDWLATAKPAHPVFPSPAQSAVGGVQPPVSTAALVIGGSVGGAALGAPLLFAYRRRTMGRH